MSDFRSSFLLVLKLVAPPLLGEAGALLATYSPAYHAAFCAGRVAAHSSRLERRKYAAEDLNEACTLPRAFWPSSRLSRVVPDYERALLLGNVDLDIAAGAIEISGTAPVTFTPSGAMKIVRAASAMFLRAILGNIWLLVPALPRVISTRRLICLLRCLSIPTARLPSMALRLSSPSVTSRRKKQRRPATKA